MRYHLGGIAPLEFEFENPQFQYSGYLAFTPYDGATRPLLLVTDAGHGAVHLVDVVGRTHAGYLAPPGSIEGPRGVATTRGLVAVSSWSHSDSGEHVVYVYEGSGSTWQRLRVLGSGCGAHHGELVRPCSLRFSSDGTHVAVADCGNGRVALFSVSDGVLVRHVAKGLAGPRDVEETKQGWLVACLVSNTVEHILGPVPMGGPCPQTTLEGFKCPSSLALVWGLGLFVREILGEGRLRLYR